LYIVSAHSPEVRIHPFQG